MRRHVRKHVGDRPFACVFCSFKAIERFKLMNHIKKHILKSEQIEEDDESHILPVKMTDASGLSSLSFAELTNEDDSNQTDEVSWGSHSNDPLTLNPSLILIQE